MEKGAFAHLSNIIGMGIFTETLPALGSLSAPLQTLTLGSFDQFYIHEQIYATSA